jgi:hypothetical protein
MNSLIKGIYLFKNKDMYECFIYYYKSEQEKSQSTNPSP